MKTDMIMLLVILSVFLSFTSSVFPVKLDAGRDIAKGLDSIKSKSYCPRVCECKNKIVKCINNKRAIRQVPSHIPNDTLELYLNGNAITNIQSGSFAGLVNLTKLDLTNNIISSIAMGTFDSLRQLKTLYLTQNSVQEFDGRLVSRLTKLQKIHLNQNTLHRIPDLSACVDLQYLSLETNLLKNVTFPEGYQKLKNLSTVVLNKNLKLTSLSKADFRNLQFSKMRKFTISGCKISKVENGTFSFFSKLSSLSIGYNPLDSDQLAVILKDMSKSRQLVALDVSSISFDGSLPLGIFDSMNNTNLQTLTMRHNDIKTIQSKAFSTLKTLKMLDISFSKIAGWEEEAFSGLKTLTDLRLFGNAIYTYHEGTFPSTLKKLDLSYNYNVKYISDYTFDNLRKLTELRLHHNAIIGIYKRAFSGLFSVTKLDLSHNKLAGNALAVQALNPMTNLQIINLNNNNYKKIVNEDKLFQNLPQLRQLDLSNNDCEEIPIGLFFKLTNLQYLNLRNNNFGKILSNGSMSVIFKDLIKVEEIDLSINSIELLPPSLLNNTKGLTKLNLVGNMVSHWEPNFFDATENLKDLNLGNNLISLVNSSSMKGLLSLERMNLSGNPFACNCDLVWFRLWWVNSTNITFPGLSKMMCNSPKNLAGTYFMDFDPSTLDCVDHTILMVIASTGVATLLLIVIGFTYHRHQWSIKLRLYRASKYLHSTNHQRGYQRVMTYDAYVINAQADDRWVIDNMLPNIEVAINDDPENRIKLYFDTRNSVPGMPRIKNYAENMDISRVVIAVISDNFLDDNFSLFQLSEANHIAIKEQRPLLIVFLGESVKTKCPRECRRYVDNNECEVWVDGIEGQEDGQRLLWERLRENICRDRQIGALQGGHDAELNPPV
ncbi:unnamed protein product [Owenia fusiformis]|uniref:Uncharacterized protein n=1 Tax=Owenia fusiformis TaxID=6347 RepID=A0A8J1Y0M9_OWEFU|nr:unnamed protein product [Owenia fusiformis]